MPSSERFHEVAAQVRNWGRWGDDDEIGTLNLITPEVRRAAAASVRSGKAFSLALPLDEGLRLEGRLSVEANRSDAARDANRRVSRPDQA